MEQQQKLLEKIFQSRSLRVGYVEIVTRKLPLFGQQVSADEIDFEWSAEEFIKFNGGLEKIKLEAIKFGEKGNCLAGIQLMFSGVGEIESPCFGAKEFNEDTLTKSPFTQNADVTRLKVRIYNSMYQTELKFFSGDSEILTSAQFTSSGSFVEQKLDAQERIIGVYGVKGKQKYITSLGFILGKKAE